MCFLFISLGSGQDDGLRACWKETDTMMTFSGIPVLSGVLVAYLTPMNDYPICSSIKQTLSPQIQGPGRGTNQNMAEWCPGRVQGLTGEKDVLPVAHTR